jgi:serine/threonine protein kinase
MPASLVCGQLNHANILAIFDVGTHERTPYIVSELLRGETLRHQTGKYFYLRGWAVEDSVLV